jgi:hypothetical protein
MFQVEYTFRVKYSNGVATFKRIESIEFAPFVGLHIIDEALGQFQIEWVAWFSLEKLFLCQSTAQRNSMSFRDLAKTMKQGGWQEERDERRSESSKS